MNMHILDAFNPDLPEHLVGVFDIVHVRNMSSAVKNNAVGPLLKNLVQMLSQWLQCLPKSFPFHFLHFSECFLPQDWYL
jgi:hypothetical protein